MSKYVPTESNLWNSSLVMLFFFFFPNRTTILKLLGGMDSFGNISRKMDKENSANNFKVYRSKLKTPDTTSHTFM